MSLTSSRRAFTALAAVLFWLLAPTRTWTSDEKPDPPTEPAYTGPRIVTLDDQFVEVGELVPDFGGMYLKGDALQIVVKNLGRLSRKERKAKQAELEAALQTVFEDSLEGKAEKVRLVEGRYSVLELQRWYRNFGEILALSGVASADFDEVANRLKIVVTEEAPVEKIKALLREWRVPSDAVAIASGRSSISPRHSERSEESLVAIDHRLLQSEAEACRRSCSFWAAT